MKKDPLAALRSGNDNSSSHRPSSGFVLWPRKQKNKVKATNPTSSLTMPHLKSPTSSRSRAGDQHRLQSPGESPLRSQFSSDRASGGIEQRDATPPDHSTYTSSSNSKPENMDKGSSISVCSISTKDVDDSATQRTITTWASSHGTTRTNLNLVNNDNSFHVLANLVVNFFKSKKVPSLNSFVFFPKDREQAERFLPVSARDNFIEAVRQRMERIPAEPKTPLDNLVLECSSLGFARKDGNNPILAIADVTTEPVTVKIGVSRTGVDVVADDATISTKDSSQKESNNEDELQKYTTNANSEMSQSSKASFTISKVNSLLESGNAVRASSAQQHDMSVTLSQYPNPLPASDASAANSLDDLSLNGQNKILRARLKQQEKQLSEQQAIMASVMGEIHPDEPSLDSTNSGETFDVSQPSIKSNSVRQHILTELNEASNLLAQSVTPDTVKFWGDQVVELQNRLRAFDAGDTGVANERQQQPPSREADDILEKNRRLMAEFQQRDQYVPPVLDSFQEAPWVDVVAPADLPGGYQFEAEIEGQSFLAVVPDGGVEQGETFTCLMRELDPAATDIPVGHWKDNVYDIFVNGVFHQVPWSSLFCPLLVLSQIQTRTGLDFLGNPQDEEDLLSNRSMMEVVTSIWILLNGGLVAGFQVKFKQDLAISAADIFSVGLVNIAMFAFIVFVAQNTRKNIREKFMIHEQGCNEPEGILCTTLLLPFIISQMARHTADYEKHEAVCCSETGLADGVSVNQAPKVDESNGYIV